MMSIKGQSRVSIEVINRHSTAGAFSTHDSKTGMIRSTVVQQITMTITLDFVTTHQKENPQQGKNLLLSWDRMLVELGF